MQPVPWTDLATYFNHDRMQPPPSPPSPRGGVDDRRYHDQDCVPRDSDARFVEQIWVTWVHLRRSANPVNLL